MNKYLSYCLAFAGFTMLFGAAISSLDWYMCVSHSGGTSCRAIRSEAVTTLFGAANSALGVALQEKP